MDGWMEDGRVDRIVRTGKIGRITSIYPVRGHSNL